MLTDRFEKLGAEFVSAPQTISNRLKKIKAFVFDWDGVFNDAGKNENLSSNFNEVDSMGTNLLRFSYFLSEHELPITGLISGEKNILSFTFSKREHFDSCYFKIADKKEALFHFCEHQRIKPEEVCYFFDDVLDLSIAKLAGLRILIGRKSNPLFNDYLKKNLLTDYISGCRGGEYGLRESCEMLMGIAGRFDEVIQHRTDFSLTYKTYIDRRNSVETFFYTKEGNTIVNGLHD